MSTQKPVQECLFKTTLFIITKSWKQRRCPSVGKWINHDTATQWNHLQC